MDVVMQTGALRRQMLGADCILLNISTSLYLLSVIMLAYAVMNRAWRLA